VEGFWQAFDPAPAAGPPYGERFSVELAPGQCLALPIRPLPDGQTAVASLIANQASFTVLDGLTERMVALAAVLQPEVIVGLPTLGLAFAPGVARGLGHAHFVPLGYSRKFWYRDEMSVPIRSITTPGEGKRLYVDPLILPRLAGRRVVVVDDVASTGASLTAVAALLGRLDVEIAGGVVAMRQGASEMALPVSSVFQTPRFVRKPGGWWPI
jgi:adenine/guanine phosphoribosyltransferase-like PRPP-binding protein